MGWCSGTVIFDRVADFVLTTDASDSDKAAVLHSLAESLEEMDWDCQADSDYYDHPIVKSIMKQLHPDWEDDE